MKRKHCWKKMAAVLMTSAAVTCLMSSAVSAGTSNVNETIEGDAVQRAVVNVGIETDPADLSPFGPETTGRTAVLDTLYESLGFMINGEFSGVLAKDYELSEDETTLIFHLYENITDQAGNPFTANDVVFCFNKKKESGNFFNIGFIDSVEAVDDYTVQFNLIPPLKLTDMANLVQNLYLVTEAAYEASADGMVTGGVVSTAPYKMADYQSGYMLTLEKNTDYWQKDESLIHERSQANVDTINYYVLAESNQRTMALESGTIDMCWSIAGDDVSKFEEGGEQSGDYWVYENSDNLSSVLLFNQSDSHITSDENLRKAIGYSINTEAILMSVYNGHGETPHDIARSVSAGYDAAWNEEDNFYQYDAEKAAEALSASDYTAGTALVLLCNTDTASTNTATLIQGLCAANGITVEINSVDSAVVNTYFADESAWDLYLTQTAAETYCVQPWMKHMDCSSGENLSFFADDELQKLLTEASAVSTSTQDTINACHEYMTEHAYIRGMVNVYNSYVVPRTCRKVVLGYKNSILPGACEYVG